MPPGKIAAGSGSVMEVRSNRIVDRAEWERQRAAVAGGPGRLRTDADPRVVELEEHLDGAEGDERSRLRVALADVRASGIRQARRGAAGLDRVHTVERALRVGSIEWPSSRPLASDRTSSTPSSG
jgi:hypothetical protein